MGKTPRVANLRQQNREREATLVVLRDLRSQARAEIDRLLAFLDASDLDPDLEPSLGFLERHPSVYGGERDRSGNQERLCEGLRLDVEDEHNGAEPGDDDEPSLGALEGHTDQRAAWHVVSVNDYELDHSESGIGDHDGLLEQVGTQDWQQGGMA
ncbi:hypothetical protein QCM77_18885 [Bradyrhizobium sp. SSUT18]|uniref:hypothetical protein n=1 Tax=Bradyrhizobium sp. SSUT18 TaxID=3040602 RepID=UPI00244A5F0D|nr:hypothetical protein [Bradyrhizobium sp. SSUT18]MDH2402008.1 hypothetical protein [Bradyrhizobium sp. SSUT18]